MIPVEIIWADFKRLWLGSIILVVMIALTIGLSLVINLQERAIREGSAAAADRFDLIVGGAGSETQLVLSTVFLKEDPLPIMSNKYWQELAKDPLVAWVAPLAFGDFYQGKPIVGTTVNLLKETSKESALASGNWFNEKPPIALFKREFDAVVGAKSGLNIGDSFHPLHSGTESTSAHVHNEVTYKVVGILKDRYDALDQGIFVPIQAVWSIHGMHGIDHETSKILELKNISALVVKPKSIAAAYQLRAKYRQGETQAVFPAEILTKLYGTLGDIKQVLHKLAFAIEVIALVIILMIAIIYINWRQKLIASLRIFGAGRLQIMLTLWLGLMALVSLGMLLGVLFGYFGSSWLANVLAKSQGFNFPIYFIKEDILQMLYILLITSVMLLLITTTVYRNSIIDTLKS